MLLFSDGWLARLPEPGVINVCVALFGHLFSHAVITSRSEKCSQKEHGSFLPEMKRHEQLKSKAVSC